MRPSTRACSATLSTVPTINPGCCCLPVASLLAPSRIALLRTHLPRRPNPHSQAAAPSAHHRPRVRSLAASGRRPPCTWLRRSWPASETLHNFCREQIRRTAALFDHLVSWARPQFFGITLDDHCACSGYAAKREEFQRVFAADRLYLARGISNFLALRRCMSSSRTAHPSRRTDG